MYTDVDNFELIEHYTDSKNTLGYDTVWSLKVLVQYSYSMTYGWLKIMTKEMGKTFDDVTFETSS